MKKFIFTLLLVLCLTSPCIAAEWYWIGNDNEGDSCFIDNSSVSKDQYYAKVWIKINHPDSSYYVARFILNHDDYTLAVLSYAVYDNNGNMISSKDIPDYN